MERKDIPTGVVAVYEDMQMILDLIVSFIDLADEKVYKKSLNEHIKYSRKLNSNARHCKNEKIGKLVLRFF